MRHYLKRIKTILATARKKKVKNKNSILWLVFEKYVPIQASYKYITA